MAEREKPQFSEDEDLERARAFWKENGRSIVGGIALGLAAIVGFNYWQYYQRSQGETASVKFDEIRSSADAENVQTIANDLMDNHGSSPYASLGALIAAKKEVESDNLDGAKDYLNWVMANANDPGVEHIARLRLASILVAQSRGDEAITLLNVADMATFEARYLELTGDAHFQLGNMSEAATSYERSLEILPASAANKDLIELKLENTNEAS